MPSTGFESARFDTMPVTYVPHLRNARPDGPPTRRKYLDNWNKPVVAFVVKLVDGVDFRGEAESWATNIPIDALIPRNEEAAALLAEWLLGTA